PFLLVKGIVFTDEEGRVREQPDILLLDAVVRERVVDHAGQKSDVRAGADLREVISYGRGTVETRINGNELGVAVTLRLHDEAEAHRVVFCRVAAHDQDQVGVADIGPTIGHRPAPESGGQTGHRRAVSYSGLLLEGDHSEPSPGCLYQQIVVLVRVGAAADDADGRQRVDRLPLVVLLHQLGVARVFDQAGDAVKRPVPRLGFPLIAARRAVLHLGQPAVIDDVLLERDTL